MGLTYHAKSRKNGSELRSGHPQYYNSQQKVEVTGDIEVGALLEAVKNKYSEYDVTDIDGVKIDFPDRWVHLRKSNTEPIIRVYAEASSSEEAEKTAAGVMDVIKSMCN